MKFANAVLDIIGQIRMTLALGLPHVLRAIFASPSLIFNPAALSRISFANVWIPFSQGLDEHTREDKAKLITPHATGAVLDLGAGHGYTANYLDRTKVTKYIAVEPNTLMHSYIRDKAQAAGYTEADGSLVILACGAEDTATIISATHAEVDTIVSVHTLCTVPAPQQTLRALVQDVLASGGEFLFIEHVRSPCADVAWWQKFWTPVWRQVFDGCCLDRPTHLWVVGLVDENGESMWAEGGKYWSSDFPEEHLFWRQQGRFVKK
ncbi:S-adenosyl-L-methionine-dependent methyltransferase [Mycena maculata]|uniref:S-adenosyl-L-methionine-dependent methyltransferase n=1 Tax=Mycena maculata TaxID=230809 RepID=A0AAD7MXM2_9AGAR|nr:S-adenosyl-L-methionine-dependent methyltransferase [Mycena maculata]